MFIYLIRNKKNGKVLVGQTTRTVDVRWKEHRTMLRKGKHENPRLQNAYNKYGEQVFVCETIRECKTQKRADVLEEKYRLDYYPNVYNLRPGGNGGFKAHPDTRKRMSASQKQVKRPKSVYSAMSKKRWSTPEAHKWRVEMNKKMFAEGTETRKRILDGLLKYAKDFAWKSKTGKEVWKRKSYRAKFEKNYGLVRSPNGKIYEVVGLRKFSRRFHLDPSTLSKLCSGIFKQYKGWTKVND